MRDRRESNVAWLLPLLLVLVAAVYRPVWRAGFIWDDDHHVTPAALQSADGLRRIWTEPGATQQYYPVTYSAFWLERQWWGRESAGYHAVNIALHALAAFLFVLLLRRLGVAGAVGAGVLFAIHPVNVESVAWISELKNTLSTVFYLASALAYLRYHDSRRAIDYAAAFALFVCALGSKTVTATLPIALLVVLWWRQGRLDWRRDVAPLVPWVAAGVAAGLTTAWVERHFAGAQGAEFQLTLVDRVLVSGRAIAFYLAKLVWPVRVMFVYPRWTIDSSVWWQWLFPIAALLGAAALWMMRRRTRAPLAAFLLFAIALAPALGFVDVFPFRYSFVADHFQYLATMPAIAFACAAVSATVRDRRLAAAALALCATPLAVVAYRHAGTFASAETLYRATLERNPGAGMAHNNLAMLLMADGRTSEAREHFLAALAAEPKAVETRLNVARLLIEEGDLDRATEHLRAVVAIDPRIPDAHSNLGVVLLRQGRAADAIREFDEALRHAPDHPQARANLAAAHQQLGVAAAQAGRYADAAQHFEAAVRAAPSDGTLRYNLGTAYLAAGRARDAVAQLQEAVRLSPGLDAARANLAAAQQQAR